MRKYRLSVLRHLSTDEKYAVRLVNLEDGSLTGGLATREQVGKWILTVLAKNVKWPASIEIETDLIDLKAEERTLDVLYEIRDLLASADAEVSRVVVDGKEYIKIKGQEDD